MTSLLTKLFPPRPQTIRNAARRAAPLGLQQLDDRLVPTVTTTWVPNGTLAITGDAANDRVYLDDLSTPGMVKVAVQAVANGPTTVVRTLPKALVRDITFDGGAGDDVFNGIGMLSGPPLSSINGGPGNDLLIGTAGDDVFVGSPRADQYYGFSGNNVLNRNGYRGYFADNAPTNATTGLVTGTLSYGELTAPGSRLFARLNPADGTKLEVYGPSGAGFTLKATGWTATPDYAAGRTQFKATGSTVQLDTGRGSSIPLPASAFQAVRVSWARLGMTAGAVESGLSLDLTSALSGSLSAAKEKAGVDVTLPSLGGGIQLGANLGHLDLPVASAVPYLYATLSPDVGVSIAGASPNVPNPAGGWGVSVAVDPTDVGALVKLKTPAAEVGFGWSGNGEIPYLPTLTPDDRANPQIAGNLYVYASGQLPGLPVSVTGDLVLDLDANGDGVMAGLTPQQIGKIAKGDVGLGTLVGAVNDIKFGLNGQVDASLPISKAVDLSLTLGQGSLYWTPAANGRPGEAAFRVASANPFADTPFKGMFGGMGFDFQGRFDTRGDFRLAAASTGTSVDVEVGGVSLGSVHQSFGVEFVKAGSVVSLGANYHFDMTVGNMSFLGASVAIDAEIKFAVDTKSGRISVSGHGTVDADVCLFGVGVGVDLGLSFGEHGIKVDLPGDPLDFQIKW